jgi:hypothetical protein
MSLGLILVIILIILLLGGVAVLEGMDTATGIVGSGSSASSSSSC